MFDLDGFIADCKAAMTSGGAQKAIRELMREAVSDPAQVIRVLGEPKKAGIEMLYINLLKTSTPGNLLYSVSLRYRLVAT